MKDSATKTAAENDALSVRPLQGLKVVDFLTLLPGPLASLIRVEAGAEVIKIERPGRGDAMRSSEPGVGSRSAIFALPGNSIPALPLPLVLPYRDPVAAEEAPPL